MGLLKEQYIDIIVIDDGFFCHKIPNIPPHYLSANPAPAKKLK
ncbi:MAG: hypothetical protein AABX79_03140 [Nanoarchaeota archaeon]